MTSRAFAGRQRCPCSTMRHVRRPLLAALSAVVAVWLGIVIAAPARAQEQVADFDVAVEVRADTTMAFVERITYEFPAGQERHGIVRNLVLSEPVDGGGSWRYGVSVTSVTADGAPVPFSTSREGRILQVRIGDPAAVVTGTIEYEIAYEVAGGLRAYAAGELAGDEPYSAGDVEFYWDLIGSGWDVPIAQARATVTGPQPALAYACYAGAVGSESECGIAEDGPSLAFGPVSLARDEAMTGVIAYPGSAFTVAPSPDIAESGLLDDPLSSGLIALPLALIALAAPIIPVVVSRRRLRGAELDGSPVQFGPPGDLRPAQLQASATGEVDAAGALATLLDLVGRGHISMTVDDGGFMQKSSITITWRSENPDDMAEWEQHLLGSILNGEEEATLEGYNEAFATYVKELSGILVDEATAAGRWSANRNPAWRRWLAVTMGAGIALGFAGFLLGGASDKVGLVVIGVMVGAGLAVGAFIAYRLVPIHQTPESAQFLAEYRGFRRLLETDAAEARRELVHRMGLPDYAVFATLLPYAVIYDLDEAWTKAFPDLEPEDLNRAGYNVSSMAIMGGLVSAGRSSMASATNAPGSGRSSGSGFSGGSSGGGGGGGGGGSW